MRLRVQCGQAWVVWAQSREREREREDTAALKTGSGRAGQGWAFASNVGRLWAKREAGNGSGAHEAQPQSAQFLGRLEPISILQHTHRLSFISAALWYSWYSHDLMFKLLARPKIPKLLKCNTFSPPTYYYGAVQYHSNIDTVGLDIIEYRSSQTYSLMRE